RSPTPGSMCSAVSISGHKYGTVAIVLKVVDEDTMYILHGNSNANLTEDPWSVAIKDWSVQKVSTKSYTYRDGASAAWVFANPPR
ncbi:MAG: CHAP domain-containing protein, partial [Erysipelotrichaceae bacterium]|nr:CHAP domain-containing protein [Erysipelotrichaceae bacterium]